ncbi:MAG: ribonuclease HII [Bacteroidia bacterium]|nr:ribonuclease HII [Bacteroidia bacterium]
MLQSYLHKHLIEAGCDEAGRGCLAGPVFAAAVILPPNTNHELLRDSKKLNVQQRLTMRQWIETNALTFAVAQLSAQQIDKINILNASIKAMHLALDKLTITPQFLLIDGNRFKTYNGIKHQCVVKGDNTFACIAAASILAKTYRDEFILTMHNEFPQYDWINNKTYGTAKHIAAIQKFGNTKYHRKSFVVKAKQLSCF